MEGSFERVVLETAEIETRTKIIIFLKTRTNRTEVIIVTVQRVGTHCILTVCQALAYLNPYDRPQRGITPVSSTMQRRRWRFVVNPSRSHRYCK